MVAARPSRNGPGHDGLGMLEKNEKAPGLSLVMKAIEITPGALVKNEKAPGLSLQEAGQHDIVIRCDYDRPTLGSVETLGWQVRHHMGNSKPHLAYYAEAHNNTWPQAMAAAHKAVAAVQQGATRLAMGCTNGIYRSPACATIAAVALHHLGYTVHVRPAAWQPSSAAVERPRPSLPKATAASHGRLHSRRHGPTERRRFGHVACARHHWVALDPAWTDHPS